MSKTKTKTAKPASKRMLVVYGFDDDNKPRAAKFTEEEFELARKAADMMKLRVYEDEASKLKRILKKIPAGQIYASGWAFTGSLRQSQYDALAKNISAIEAKKQTKLTETGRPTDWQSIGLGHLVLAQEKKVSDGWWESIVVQIDGEMLTLQFRDYPTQPKIKRHRAAVALLDPGN